MLEKVTEILGGMTKWVVLGVVGVIAILAIVLITFIAINIKWVLLGSGVAIIFAIIGIVLYKKIKK